MGPVGPVSPVGPIGPVGPVTPVGPLTPVLPVVPVEPVPPVCPVGPLDPVEPVVPVGPVGPTGPVAILTILTPLEPQVLPHRLAKQETIRYLPGAMFFLILAPARTGFTPLGATPQTLRRPSSQGPGARLVDRVTLTVPVAFTGSGLRITDATMYELPWTIFAGALTAETLGAAAAPSGQQTDRARVKTTSTAIPEDLELIVGTR